MQLQSIGRIERDEKGVRILVDEAFRPGMKRLGEFSHVVVLWWADSSFGADSEEVATLQCHPPYAQDVLAGVFACRSPFRPNPVMVSVCPILSCDEKTGVVTVADIDAMDGTALLDLKAYFPVLDRVRECRYADWLEGWPQWMPDEGIGLM